MRPALRTLTFAAIAVAFSYSQVAEKANERYQTEQGRANVAKGLGSADRDKLQRPVELVASIGVKPGMTVADVGTGVGYMLPSLSAAVGPQGKVLGEDIFDDFLAKAKATVEKAALQNVQFVKGTEKTANLPAGEVDVILALDSYHHFNYPKEMLASFKQALKPGGRLAIVEYYRREGAMNGQSALTHIRVDDSGVIKEVEAAGFKLLDEHEHIPKSQYVALFERK